MVNGKGYVGKTIRTLEQRWYDHCRFDDLVIGKAIRKYGVHNFETCILAETDNQPELNRLEREHIEKQGTRAPHGYNMNGGGEGIYNPSEEVRAKMRESHRGQRRSQSAETRAKISIKLMGNKSNTGRHFSEERKAKIAAKQKGVKRPPLSEEWRAKISAAHKGWPHHPQTQEARAKMSAAKMGKPAWNKGIPMKPDAKAKMIAAKIGKPAWNKGLHISDYIQ